MAKKKKDNLTKIEGVGPAAVKLLLKGGIKTFEDLSNAKVSELRKILGTKRYNPTTWARQAKLAAKGDWNKLGNLKEQLAGGTPKKTTTKKKAAKKKASFATELRSIQKEMKEHWQELMQEKSRLEKIKAEISAEIFSCSDSVKFVKIDFKMKDGAYLRPLKYAICIGVDVKKHKKDVVKKSLFKSKYKGVPTDICEVQIVPAVEHTTPRDPLLGGIAIAREDNRDAWGTLGFPVMVPPDDELMFLTAQHVACLARSDKLGGEIIQPPKGNAGNPLSEIIIGNVDRVGGKDHARVDAALIKSRTDRDVVSELLTSASGDTLDGTIGFGSKLNGTDEKRTIVFKIGAATGFRALDEGIVWNVDVDVKVPGIRNNVFANQIEVRSSDGSSFIKGGDSGSVLVAQDETDDSQFKIVGLVFAESTETDRGITTHKLFANHISDVKKALYL